MSKVIKSIKPSYVHRFVNPVHAINAYLKTLPENGDYIKMLWMPDNNGEKNAYIGMEGFVTDMKTDGSFVLQCETCCLIHSSASFHYQILEPRFQLTH